MLESRMANLLLRLLPLLCLLYLVHSEDDLGCPISNCSSDGPLIKFPFRLKGDPPHCGDPQFELACLNNSAAIHLSPSSGLFLIKTIDYNAQQFRVYDADGCLPKRLVNFSFPTFPFHQVQKTEPNSCPFYQLTLLNCSTEQDLRSKVSVDYLPINCLSVPGHQILAAPPLTSMAQLPVPSCTTLIAEISFPVIGGQSPVENNSFVCEPDNALWLQYSWKRLPACQKCRDVDGGRCKFSRKRNEMKCSIHPHRGSMIIGVSIACVVLIFVSAVLAIVFRSKYSNWREEKENQMKIEMFLKDHQSHVPTRYSYADINKMAKGFQKKLGEGKYGTVFEGQLPNGYSVAIKVLNDSKGNGEDFVNEVGTIGRIHHVNVVRLLGFSADQGCKRALIYELMPNKSLEKFISSAESDSTTSSLDWKKLHHVITGVAKGIEYLHQGCDQRILHFDIKPHNILLDNDFNPKISDFGLAKLCPKDESVISMAMTRGTEGYIAPEVRARNFGNVSYKSDVYSFGMLALDMIEARKEAVPTPTNNEVTHFPDWIYNRLIQEETLGLQLDSDGDSDQIAKKLVIVALWCIQWYPMNRPSMKAVVRMLDGSFESLIMPPNPFASTS